MAELVIDNLLFIAGADNEHRLIAHLKFIEEITISVKNYLSFDICSS